MAKIINLRTRKRQKARVEKARIAEANAAKFGRSRAEKTLAASLDSLARARLDGHRLPDPNRTVVGDTPAVPAPAPGPDPDGIDVRGADPAATRPAGAEGRDPRSRP